MQRIKKEPLRADPLNERTWDAQRGSGLQGSSLPTTHMATQLE